MMTKGPVAWRRKRKEHNGTTHFLQRAIFTILLKEEVPASDNTIPNLFVFTIKSIIDGKIKLVAQLAVGGHQDELKDLISRSCQTL